MGAASILERYDEIMHTDFRLSQSHLSKLADELDYYMRLGQIISDQQQALDAVRAETDSILEQELECKKVLDEATDAVLKCAAAFTSDRLEWMDEQYQTCLERQRSARQAYDSAMLNTKHIRELSSKLAGNLYDLKIIRKYINDRTFGGALH